MNTEIQNVDQGKREPVEGDEVLLSGTYTSYCYRKISGSLVRLNAILSYRVTLNEVCAVVKRFESSLLQGETGLCIISGNTAYIPLEGATFRFGISMSEFVLS